MPATVQLRASDRRSNFLNVAALGAVTFVCLVAVILTLAKTKRPIWPFDSILHFCNFTERHGPILHYRHIFAVRADMTV